MVRQGKILVLILVNELQNFVLVCMIMLIKAIFLLMEKKSLNLNPNGNVYHFLVDHSSFDKSDILNIYWHFT